MKILFTGATGQLGHEFERTAAEEGITAIGLAHKELDVTRPESIQKAVEAVRPTILVNTAAYTAVDAAENEIQRAFAVNRDGPLYLARICAAENIPLIHISSDYVFDGTQKSAYLEDDPIHPINAYGRSKAEGELQIRQTAIKHIILRTSWLYSCYGKNFVKTMLKLGRGQARIGVVEDQFGCPTYAADLARAILAIAKKGLDNNFSQWGIYHYANQGIVSWYEFAKAIFEIAENCMDLKLEQLDPLTTDQYPTIAARPAYSVLDSQKISRQFGIDPPVFRNGLERMLSRLFTGAY